MLERKERTERLGAKENIQRRKRGQEKSKEKGWNKGRLEERIECSKEELKEDGRK